MAMAFNRLTRDLEVPSIVRTDSASRATAFYSQSRRWMVSIRALFGTRPQRVGNVEAHAAAPQE
jgi:hypothetical protein